MKKYIFLDMDGVITSLEYQYKIDPKCVENLEKILDRTGAKLIITSSWRKSTTEETVEYFKKEGFPLTQFIEGVTIRGYKYVKDNLCIPRGIEIDYFLKTNIEFGKILGKDYQYVILDDDSDMLLKQKDHFIHTDTYKGLTVEDAENAIKILNNK